MRGLLVLLLLAGCAHSRIDARVQTSSGVPPAAGTSVRSGQVGVHVHSSALAAVIISGMFIAAAVEEVRNPRPFPGFSTFTDWFRGTPPAPALDSERRVSEQDCSRPVDDAQGNIRCK
jgi:hypothetical protein